MSRFTFSAPVELALAAGLPELPAAIASALPPALAEPLDDYRGTIAGVADAWARKLLARVLTPPVVVDATATGADAAPLGVIDNG